MSHITILEPKMQIQDSEGGRHQLPVKFMNLDLLRQALGQGGTDVSTVVYPKCDNDDIRKKPVDFTNPLDNFRVRVSKITAKACGSVCSTCSLERRIIAKHNRFDDIDGEW